MTINVEFLLRSPSLPLVSLPRALQTGTIECVHGLCIRPDVRRFMIRIDPADEVSEEELRALDEVLEATKLGRANDQIVYQLTVELEEIISEAFAPELDAAQIEPTTITPEGWHEKKVFKNYETLREFQTRCEEYDISIELVSISPNTDGSDEPADYGLTDRQREALTLAISRGYYESPRQVSAEELAEELGISQPALSDLLRRGERQLLSSALGSPEQLNTVSR